MDSIINEKIIGETKYWMEQAVIGLNLCPFASTVHVNNQIRYVISDAATHESLLKDFMQELEILAEMPAEKVETVLLIHPHVLADFIEYNDFMDVVEAALEDMDLEGELQVAGFHPQWQFAETQPDDIENYTNRSPYPMLHILREASVLQAVSVFPEAEKIFEKNIETLRKLGHSGWRDLGLDKGVLRKKN